MSCPRFFPHFLGLLLALCAAASAQPAARPNIVFLLADDLRADTLGCAGDKVIQTPHLDALAAGGAYFKNSFVTDSICAPSRASILSGQWVRRHKIDDFAKTFTAEQWAATYPALLRKAGYRTGFIGKYGVGNRMPEAEFDFWRGFRGQGSYFEKGNSQHLTARMGDQALEFLRERSDRPFCLSISFKAPHSQGEKVGEDYPIDPRDAQLYAAVAMPEFPSAPARFFEGLPGFLQKSEGRSRWLTRGFEDPAMREEGVRNYYRLVTGMDREIGRIRDALAELGLAENTLIVFTSDNGYFLGARGLVDKFFAYEESMRVPLIIFDPRLSSQQRGQRIEPMALNVDLAPTLLDYAGIPAPASMQGRSVRPLVEGREVTDWRRDFFYEHHFRYGGRIPPSEAVRGERWCYVRFYDEKPVFEQLFDLAADPAQERNLASDPQHAGVLKEMRARWRELATALY
jgi:arylsulfatase A-like enzyme